MIPLIPVDEAHFAKSVAEAEFVFKIVREFPPFPIKRAASGIAFASAVGAKLIKETRREKTKDKIAKALETALREDNTRKLY